MDKRKNNGGKREGSGAKQKDYADRKVQITFGVKRKYFNKTWHIIKPIIDKINES